MVISSAKEVVLKDMHKKMDLPEGLKRKIEEFWKTQIEENPHLFNGKVWNVTGKEENLQSIQLILEETDYAHYLYDERHGVEEKYACHNLSGGVFIETIDGFAVVGELDETTSYPRCLQVSGGGIDPEQDKVDGEFDIIKTAERELKEELNLDLKDKKHIQSYRFKYLEVPEGSRHSYCVILRAKANFTAAQLEQHFREYKAYLEESSGEIEFSKLHFLTIGNSRRIRKIGKSKKNLCKTVVGNRRQRKRKRKIRRKIN